MHMHEWPVAGARVTKPRNMEIMVSETDIGSGNFFLLAQFLRTLLRQMCRLFFLHVTFRYPIKSL